MTRPSDVIWGLVCGFSEPMRSGRLLLMLKAYFDDSNMSEGQHAVLAGWLATANDWARFSNDWDKVLWMSPRIRYFKWREFRGGNGEFAGISNELATEKVNLLADVLAENPPLGIASVVSNKLHNDIFRNNPDSILRNPYFLSFYSVVIQLAEFLAARGIKEKVDFIFDIQPGQMEAATGSWERMREIAPPAVHNVIGYVGFHDDEDVRPDLSAGWMREQADANFSGQPEPIPPWGDKTNHIQCLTRMWTAELYEELARRTGTFKMPNDGGS